MDTRYSMATSAQQGGVVGAADGKPQDQRDKIAIDFLVINLSNNPGRRQEEVAQVAATAVYNALLNVVEGNYRHLIRSNKKLVNDLGLDSLAYTDLCFQLQTNLRDAFDVKESSPEFREIGQGILWGVAEAKNRAYLTVGKIVEKAYDIAVKVNQKP